MASIYGAYSKYTRLRIDYSISQNINENTSTISMTMYAERTKASQQAYTNSIYNMTGKGDTKFTYNWSSSSYELEIGTSSVTITHNPDGTASTTLSGYWNTRRTGSSYIPQELWISQTITLPTIARKSQVGLHPTDITLGDSITIYTNRQSTTFTHALYWQGPNGAWNNIAANVTDSYSWNTSNAISNIATQFPNSSRGNITIICETYNNGTYIGSTTAILNFSITAKPTVSSISKSGGISGIYVEDVSSVTTNVTASGIYGSSISTYRMEMYNGSTKIKESYGSSSSASFTLSGLNLSADANITLKATIIDTRGNSGTASTTINVKHYYKPQITSRSVYRVNSSNKPDTNGTRLFIYWAYSTKAISGVTTDTAIVQYRKKGDSTWTPVTVANDGVAYVDGISTDYQYEVQFSISDGISAATVITDTVPTGSVTVDYRAGGKGIAFGKVSEKDEFEVAMPTTFYKGNDFKVGNWFRGSNRYFVEQFFEAGISFNNIYMDNVNYNDVRASGIYYMGTGCSNAPNNGSYLKLLSMGSSGSGDLVQIATTVVGGSMYVRCCMNGTWYNWKEIGVADEKAIQVSTPGWYRIAKLGGNGHFPNSAAVLNISTGYNYNSPCSILASVITSYKDVRMSQLTAININGAAPMLSKLRTQYDSTNGGFYVDVYYVASTQNPIRVRNESIINKEIELLTPTLVSTEYTTVDQFDIDYTGTNLRPRMILTAKPSSRLTITGTEWTPTVIPLNTVHGPNLSDGKLGISNGGIIIGSEVKKIKVSASISYYEYPIAGEADLVILKNSQGIGGIMSTCPHASQIINITSNTFIVDVTVGDLIKLAITKGSSNPMTILDTYGATSLTVEAIG